MVKILHCAPLIFFICGIAAGIVAVALSLISKIYFNGIFVPEIASQALVSLSSGEIESRAVETLGPLAKYSTFFGATFVNVLLYGIIGILLGIIINKFSLKKFIARALLCSFIPYIILLVVIVSFIIINTAPGQKVFIPSFSLIVLLIPHVIYGFIFSFFFQRLRKKNSLSPRGQKQTNTSGDMANKTPSPSYTAEIDYNKRVFVTCNLSICNCATYNVFWIYPPILTSITTTII